MIKKNKNSYQSILEIISKIENKDKYWTINDFMSILNISQQAVNKSLNKLVFDKKMQKFIKNKKNLYLYISTEDNLINKKLFWFSISDNRLSATTPIICQYSLEKNWEKDLDFFNKIILKDNDIKNFFKIYPDGKQENGVLAFLSFCRKNNRELKKTFDEYKDVLDKYNCFRNGKDEIINANNKIIELKNKLKNVFIDEMYYLDYYSYPIFGKTKLGAEVQYSKNSQDLKLMREVFKMSVDKIINFIKKNKIKSISFVPPSINRNPQFMTEFRKCFLTFLDERKIEEVIFEKFFLDIKIQQKTLKNLSDRIENAESTFKLSNIIEYKNQENILLIDDAVGSGATFNVLASKIKNNNIANKVFCIAIVGSLNGFDIINEV